MQVLFKDDIRNIENYAANAGFSTYSMMVNAGVAAAGVICEKYNTVAKKVLVLCGNGNNGGDGFIAAKKLYDEGANVSVLLTSGLPQTENAKLAVSKLSEYPINVYDLKDCDINNLINSADFIIDAVFGIGFHGAVEQTTAKVFALCNSSSAVRISLDIPSGCECDTGKADISAFNADLTVSFIAVKPCHILYPASDYCGKLINVSIGIPQSKMPALNSHINIISDTCLNALPKLRKNEHKGSRGTVLNISGAYGMAGATYFSSSAAYKSGAGKVKVLTPQSVYAIAAALLPEGVYLPLENCSANDILTELKLANAVVIGCGCRKSEDFAKRLELVLNNATCPVVIDADGINILSENIHILKESNADIIITPHPAEMARLLKTTVTEINENRLKVAQLFAKQFGVTLVLKGANTLVADKNGEIYVCMHGNPGMATAGSGDVLAGIIGALCCGMSPKNSAICGVQIHALAGDAAVRKTSAHSLTASDILNNIHVPFQKAEGMI